MPLVALADSAEELRARGEQLAKDGRYTEAVDAFKAAERIEPRARHSCLIALAYTRRELWPQAEIFLDQCEARATPADPLPEWVPMAKQQLAQRLATVNVAPITIEVEPPGVAVKLAVSSFAPDELFTPRTIHLPPGRHVVIATAKGFNDSQKTIEVTDKGPQHVVITMLPIGSDQGSANGHLPPPPRPAPSKVPYMVMGAGGGVVVVGALAHVLWFRKAREELASAPTREIYDQRTKRFETSRNVTIALYGVGAATLVTGLILKATVFKAKESSVQVAVTPTDGGGAMVSATWGR